MPRRIRRQASSRFVDQDARVTEQEIDRVLSLRRKEGEAKACIPCRRRKVKCDNGSPCSTCLKRSHPQICAYDSVHRTSTRSSRVQQHTNKPSRIQQPPPSPCSFTRQSLAAEPSDPFTPESTATVQDTNSWAETNDEATSGARRDAQAFTGDNFIASIVRSKAQQADKGILAQNVGPVLGLQNTLVCYPFMDSDLPSDRWASLLKIVPQPQEILT